MTIVDNNELFLQVGKMYSLEVSSPLLHHPPIEFSGLYIGHNPSSTPSYQRLYQAEGHLFASLSRNESLELHTVRTNDMSIPQRWHSDGEDGPEWPAGIRVEKLDLNDINMTANEKNYLLSKLSRQEEPQRLAA